MSFAAARLSEPRILAAGGILVVAGGVGGLAGLDPKLAIAAAFGLAFVLVAVANLAAGVAVFGVLTFLELAPVIGGPAVSFAKVAGLTLALSWVAAVATDRDQSRNLFVRHQALTTAIVAFMVWAGLSYLWAEDPSESITTITRYALNFALFPIVFTAIREPKHLRWVAASIAGGAAAAAAYGLFVVPSAAGAATSVTAADDLDRITGTVGDPNLLASVLVVGLTMSLAVAADQIRSAATRVLGAGAALLCLTAVIATVSRGGIVALVTAMVAAVILGGKRRPALAAGAATLAILTVGFFAAFASEAQVERITTADGGTGRTDIWKVGWRMVEDEPIRGIGVGNFNISSVHYLLIEPGALERSEFIVDRPAVAHNLYLEILAELGVIGLALFLSIVGACVVMAARAAAAFERIGEAGLAGIARAIAVGLCSTLAADFFLSAQFSKLLWLLLALGPAALAVARAMSADAEQGEERTAHRVSPTTAS